MIVNICTLIVLTLSKRKTPINFKQKLQAFAALFPPFSWTFVYYHFLGFNLSKFHYGILVAETYLLIMLCTFMLHRFGSLQLTFNILSIFILLINLSINAIAKETALQLILAHLVCGMIMSYMRREFVSSLLEKYRSFCRIEEITAQVIHDLKSPLAALRMMGRSIGNTHELGNVLNLVTQRITEICDSLKSKNETKIKEIFDISILLEQLIIEKRYEYADRLTVDLRYEKNVIGPTPTLIYVADLRRAISNLINNAIESIQDAGRIKIRLFNNEAMIYIEIQDNGKGISEDALKQIGTRGFSKGKRSGTGLGIYQTKQTIAALGGHFSIRSNLNQAIALPQGIY